MMNCSKVKWYQYECDLFAAADDDDAVDDDDNDDDDNDMRMVMLVMTILMTMVMIWGTLTSWIDVQKAQWKCIY